MMSQSTDRAEQFKAEIADMKLKTGRVRAENTLQWVGVVLMVGGVVLAFIAYAASLNVTTTASNVDILNSNSYTPLAIAGLAISVSGGFLFLRYSLAKFLRFWLLRQVYEQRAAIEQAGARRDA